MADKEKIVNGLECCSESSGYGCNYCPYGDECRKATLMGCAHLCRDALELIKEQEIGYHEKSDALLKMWMDDDITDGEYGKIMDRLNRKVKQNEQGV